MFDVTVRVTLIADEFEVTTTKTRTLTRSVEDLTQLCGWACIPTVEMLANELYLERDF